MSAEITDKTDLLTGIKERCRQARSTLGYSNQDIADKISEKFNCGDFSVNTVNNFFSDRSKAATIYTTGYICAVLGVSIDEFLEIKQEFSEKEQENLILRLSALENELKLKQQETDHLNSIIKEKDIRLEKADKAVSHYRSESVVNRKMVHRWVLAVLILLLLLLLAVIAIYLFRFDLTNPDYGLFKGVLLCSPIGLTSFCQPK